MQSKQAQAEIQQEIAYYQGLIRDMPQFTPFRIKAHLKLGKLYAQSGDKEAAINEYSIAAVQYAHNGALVKAIAVNKKILDLKSNQDDEIDELGVVYFQPEPFPPEREQRDEAWLPETQDTHHHDTSVTVSEPKSLSVFAAAEEGEEAEIAAFLRQNPLFGQLSWAERQWLEEHIRMQHCAPQSVILKQDDRQESLFIVFEGDVKVVITDNEHEESVIAMLRTGDFFGEISLFTQDERCASVVAETTCCILEITKPILATLIKKHATIADTLKKYAAKRVLDNKLAHVPLFTHLGSSERQKIADFLVMQTFEEGEIIIREGDRGESMYMIKSGQVGVYTTVMEGEETSLMHGEREQLHLATLQDGDFFGEQSLIVNEPRNATIIALTDVQLLRLSRSELSAIVNTYPRVGELLGKYHQRRTTDTLEALNAAFQQIADL